MVGQVAIELPVPSTCHRRHKQVSLKNRLFSMRFSLFRVIRVLFVRYRPGSFIERMHSSYFIFRSSNSKLGITRSGSAVTIPFSVTRRTLRSIGNRDNPDEKYIVHQFRLREQRRTRTRHLLVQDWFVLFRQEGFFCPGDFSLAPSLLPQIYERG